MEALTMERPETVALTYDKSNPTAQKALESFLSLGFFQIEQTFKSQVEQGLEEYHGDTDNQEYRQLRNAFFYSSKRSMSQHISKFIEWGYINEIL